MHDVLLADDLSGALDAAAAFRRAGREVVVALQAAPWPLVPTGVLIAVNSETRNDPPARAAAVIAEILAGLQRRGDRLVYKKIDSTLRGPVAAEITALAEAFPGSRILFAPANPAVGRMVRGGVLCIHGVPVTETEYARDPVSPVCESDIRRLLAGAGGERVVIPDVENPGHLSAAVGAVAAAGGPWIAVGSGALARPVAEQLGGAGPTVARRAAWQDPPPGPVLLVGGSAHALNQLQAAELGRQRGVPVHTFRWSEPAIPLAATASDLRVKGGAALLVEATRGDSRQVLHALVAAVAELARHVDGVKLFATGGETAQALAGALGITTLTLGDEIEPGLSLARADSGRWLAIKPGGFGTPSTWVRAWDRLRG